MNYLLSEKSAAFLRSLQNPRGYSGETEPTRRIVTVHGEEDDFPPPFTVRWAQSENSGSGAWVIWLPDPARLVFYDEGWLSIGGISAAHTLPSGWYTMTLIRPQDRTVYLSVMDSRRSSGTGYKRADISRTDTQGGSAGEYFFCAKIAVMEVDSTTGARRVRQFVNSTVEVAKKGEGTDVDDVSTDYNTDSEVQIKDWDTGTPAASTTIAQDIHDGSTTSQNAVVSRSTSGVLQYKKPGTLAQLTGSSVSHTGKTIITGISWNTTSHKLEISSANIDIANGIITAWVDQQVQEIATTDITSILPSSSS